MVAIVSVQRELVNDSDQSSYAFSWRYKGAITVDGHDIRDLCHQDYRKQFGIVLQMLGFTRGTIKENLPSGNLERLLMKKL